VIDYSDFEFPKPGDLEETSPAVRIYPDGREVINLLTAEGKAEYRRRTLEMLERQDGRCCLCYQPLRKQDATFEHEAGRGMSGGHRDDRTVVGGRWINGAACCTCNSRKGSRRGTYNG
jgi:hypothetical protein